MTATDTDWSFGNLKFHLFRISLKEAPESYEAVQDAIDQFVELYSQQDVTVLEEPCDETVPNELSLLAPLDIVMDIRQSLPPETMVVIFGNWIDSDPFRLGFSGSIPGPWLFIQGLTLVFHGWHTLERMVHLANRIFGFFKRNIGA